MRYEYEVAGRVLEGDRVAFGYTGSSARKFHKEIHDALATGVQVAVRYDPNKPARAVLGYGMNQSIVFLLIFGAVWTVFTVGIYALFAIGERGAGAFLESIVIYGR